MLAIAYAHVKKANLRPLRGCSEEAIESCPDLQDRRWDKACSCEKHCVGLLIGHCIKVCQLVISSQSLMGLPSILQ